jgi:dienelactone hydrolase
MSRFRSIVSFLGAYLAMVGLALAALVGSPTPADAQAGGGFQRGPDPGANTLSSNGPFATSQTDVSGFGAGYNNVTICYPNDTSQGTFGGVVVMPGFLSLKLQMMWSCRKIASHGFVVAVAETSTILDFPAQRAGQTQAIIRHLSGTGAPAAVRQRLDTSRWAAAGWSMGGGGALDTGARNNPRIQAVTAWEPWNISSYIGMTVPTLIVGASNDFVAPAGTMAEPFYNSILGAEKYYVEVAGQGHFVGSTDNTVQSAATIAWLKRWVDDDTRYDRFLCPPPTSSAVAEIRQTCPLQGTG